MAVTICDIARELGVSHATVSRVLNRKPGTFISKATQQRVQQAARRLGYRPNLAARSLRLNRSQMVGVFGVPNAREGGVYYYVLDGILSVLREHAMDLIVGFHPAGETEHPGNGLSRWDIDGAILFPGMNGNLAGALIEQAIPCVQFNQDRHADVAAVLPDDADGVRQAVAHLAGLGHRRIAYAGGRPGSHASVGIRHAAWQATMAELGLEAMPGHDREMTDAAAFLEAVVVKGGATGILAYDHLLALDLLQAAQARGMDVPGEFSLICFNDVFPVDKVYPPLTAVNIPGEAMGRQMTELLLAMIGGQAPDAHRLVVPVSLTVRASTGPAPQAPACREKKSRRT